MKTLYLHIGRPKTGSTAIQEFLNINKEPLHKMGYFIPNTGLYYGSHGPFAWLLYKELADSYDNIYWTYCREWAVESEMPDSLWYDLQREIELDNSENIILTTEELGILDASTKEAQGLLRKHLSGFDVKVIIYIRRQDAFLESVYNQAVKGKELRFEGTFHDYLRYVGPPLSDDLDHALICDRWADSFGFRNIDVHPFEKQQFNSNLYSDFLSAIRIEMTDCFVVPNKEANVSLSREGLEILRYVNKQRLSQEKRQKVLSILSNMDNNRNIRMFSLISPSERQNILDKYKRGNEYIARKYLRRESGRLFVSPEPKSDTSWYPLDKKEIEYIYQDLIKEVKCILKADGGTLKGELCAIFTRAGDADVLQKFR